MDSDVIATGLGQEDTPIRHAGSILDHLNELEESDQFDSDEVSGEASDNWVSRVASDIGIPEAPPPSDLTPKRKRECFIRNDNTGVVHASPDGLRRMCTGLTC